MKFELLCQPRRFRSGTCRERYSISMVERGLNMATALVNDTAPDARGQGEIEHSPSKEKPWRSLSYMRRYMSIRVIYCEQRCLEFLLWRFVMDM